VKILNSKKRISIANFKVFAILLFGLLFTPNLYAYEIHTPGDTIIIGEFIYEDDYTPTTDDCTLSVYSPAGVTLVNEVTMSDEANGWHYYSYTTPGVEGKYPTTITCGTLIGGDLLKVDKSFILEEPEVTDSSIASSVWANGTRSLTSFGTLVADTATGVWASGTRTITEFGSLASDVWNDIYSPTRQLTTKNISGGGSLATESYIDASEALIITEIETNRALINALNNISANDVWASGTRTLTGNVTIDASSVDSIWDSASVGLTATGSVGKLIVDNLDAQVSTRGTSNLTAADVWASATRTLSATGVDAVTAGVWANATRTLSNYGNDITAADVWNVLSSSLVTVGSIGEQLATNVDAQISDVLTAVTALNDITAADVWAAGTRTLTSSVDISTTSVDAIWDIASSDLTSVGSIGKLVVDNLDAEVSSRGTSNLSAADVWASATRTLTDYSTSAVANAVWANGTRTLSNYGNDITAADVWNVLSSTLTTIGSIGEQVSTNLDATVSTISGANTWSVKMGNVERIQTGSVYRTKVFILDESATPTAPFDVPTVTLYDTDRNIVVSGIDMTLISTGVYEYTYTVNNAAAQGLWETIVSSEVESGQSIQTNDYWEVAGSPAQVLVNSVTANSLSSIVGNVTITNEGLSGYEYQYEWCVVTDLENDCGGNDDSYYASAAKFINPGEDWNTALSASVTTPGTYYFKLVVYFGTESSGASRVFTVTVDDQEEPPVSGGGGGGGGGGTSPAVVSGGSCNGADFNKDSFVNSVDFSILLYFFKTPFPFNNPCVDINADKKSRFSGLLNNAFPVGQ
jgi:hypothetical protein